MRKLCNSLQYFVMYGLLLDLAPQRALLILYKEPSTILEVRSLYPATDPLCSSLHPTLHSLLEVNQVTLDEIKTIHVSQGPGSFLGIRVGITLAQTLSLVKKIPTKGFPSPILYLPEEHSHGEFLFLSHFNTNSWLLTQGNCTTQTIKTIQKIKKTEWRPGEYPSTPLFSQEKIEGTHHSSTINLNLAINWQKNSASSTHINIYYPEELQNIPSLL